MAIGPALLAATAGRGPAVSRLRRARAQEEAGNWADPEQDGPVGRDTRKRDLTSRAAQKMGPGVSDAVGREEEWHDGS
ncbi:hypothetical protein E2562_010983 [Oryza meyeriana var. granulata]|uniref:Uncharacterized protein n=1 Tax=Oryza meyeriana var. granulata TaxID=110450 RepID=A0A6G1BUX5_9ORYZ|nr:hypothetical protein E2562_010983 [Oryza meyeriana var. granulata]